MQYLLSALIFTPIIAAFISLFIPRNAVASFRWITIGVSGIQILLLLAVFSTFNAAEVSFQLTENTSWIYLDLGSLGVMKADYLLGIDGLGLSMVALSVMIMLIAVISSWTITDGVKGYFILLLILNGAILGTFCALDLLLFYLFFELMLLPMYFLIGMWGGVRREYASIKFFLYTLLGSILILIVIIGLYISVQDPANTETLVHTFSLPVMYDASNFISGSVLQSSDWFIGYFSTREWAFLLLFIGFIIKLPAVPFHTWLPDAHVEAPTPVSVILAALLLKAGGYGLMRIAYPIFPDAAIYFSWLVGLIGLISIIYGALNALASKDLKRLIAYSSVSHMGFVLLGLASGTTEGISGAVYQMFSHGLLSAMLFIIAGVLYDRTNDRTIENYSGLSKIMPVYTGFVMIAFFASMGLPGLSGFIGEIMIFLGAFQSSSVNQFLPSWMAITATLGLILGAAYYLWTIQRMFHGPLAFKNNIQTLDDLDRREVSMLAPLAMMTLIFGIFPQLLLNFINPFAEHLTSVIMSVKTLNP